MHPERAALLRAIADDPDDDTVRLVYADWLGENGDDDDRARAAYIRLAVEKARLPRRHPRRVRLLDAMGVLLKAHRRRWFPWSALLHFSRRRRGFIYHARGPTTAFNTDAAALFAAEPITSLYLEPGGGGFAQFASSPLLRRLRHLSLPGGSLPPGGMAQLATAGQLTSLRSLDVVYWRSSDDELTAFGRAAWPHLRQLKFLDCGLGDGSPALLEGLAAPRLRHLGLNAEYIGSTGLRRLIGMGWVSNLTHLSLELMKGNFASEGAAKVLDSANLANLRYLDLSSNQFGADEIGSLARSGHFGRLRTLNLGQSRGGALGLLHLLRSRALHQVRDLSYSGDGANFTELAGAGELPHPARSGSNLRKLCLSGRWLGDTGFRWMLSSGVLGGIRELYVSAAGLSGSAAIALIGSPVAQSLTTLDLSDNSLRSLDGLPGSVDLPRLRKLDLRNCELGDRGATALIRALRAPNLRELTLYGNGLSNEAAVAVASNPSFIRLESLSLSYHQSIDDEGARALVDSPYLNHLRSLQLFETNVSAEALTRLRGRFHSVRSD